MPRKIPIATGSYYHVYNRGVDQREVFTDSCYYSRFIDLLSHYLRYNYPLSFLKKRLKRAKTPTAKKEIISQLEAKRISPPVEIVCFCLMPNHFHLLLKQLVENGISNFIRKVTSGYSHYFNIRQKRSGSLFGSCFKVVLVKTEEQCIHLSRYQHINPKKLKLQAKDLVDYPWSSFKTYFTGKPFDFVKPDVILSSFSTPRKYLEFVLSSTDDLEPLRLRDIALDDDLGWFKELNHLEKQKKEELQTKYLESLI